MRLTHLLAAAAIASFIAAPALAATSNPAANLSLARARAAPAQQDTGYGDQTDDTATESGKGHAGTLVIAGLAAAAVIAGAVALGSGKHHGMPASY